MLGAADLPLRTCPDEPAGIAQSQKTAQLYAWLGIMGVWYNYISRARAPIGAGLAHHKINSASAWQAFWLVSKLSALSTSRQRFSNGP